jgi:hypothetical protein
VSKAAVQADAIATAWETYADALAVVSRLEGSDDATAWDVGHGALRVRSDLELESMPPVTWLVNGMIAAGSVGAIYGAPGAGKSFLALDLAFSVATGRPWLGQPVVAGGTLYIAGEGLGGLSQRIVAWKTANNVVGQSVGIGIVTDDIDLLKDADVGRVIYAARAAQVADPIQLIVIDTLARSMIGDENDTGDMSRLLAAARRIQRATGATVVFVHHTRKDSDQERGSNTLRANADFMFYCEDGDDGRILHCRKERDAAEFVSIPFGLVAGNGSCYVQASGSRSAVEDAGEQDSTMNPKRLATLRALSEGFTTRGATTTEWIKSSGLAERTFYRIRTWLVSEGYVTETQRGGRYQISQSGLSAVGRTHQLPLRAAATGVFSRLLPLLPLLPFVLPNGSVVRDWERSRVRAAPAPKTAPSNRIVAVAVAVHLAVTASCTQPENSGEFARSRPVSTTARNESARSQSRIAGHAVSGRWL